MWVADSDDNKIYAYHLSDWARDTDKNFQLHTDSDYTTGIWSDGNGPLRQFRTDLSLIPDATAAAC